MATRKPDVHATPASPEAAADPAEAPAPTRRRKAAAQTPDSRPVPTEKTPRARVRKPAAIGAETGTAVEPAKPKARKTKTDPAQVALKPSTAPRPVITAEQRHHYVSVAAFYIAERRGFTLGNPEQDWLEAEAEIDRLIASGHFNV
ncbi:MAG: hypothetical protein OHK0048_12810 [Rhodoferax sp.]